MRKKMAEAAGWAGIAFIQGATLPSMIGVLAGWSHSLPPLSMVVSIWIGLAGFLWRSFERVGDYVGIASNGIGLLIQSALLIVILTR